MNANLPAARPEGALIAPTAAQPTSAKLPDWRRPALAGMVIVILTFGVLGGWAAVARLDSAVVASGIVAVESSRKTIQHFEGGIVREILVREGQHVEQGDLLVRLEETQFQASADISQNSLDSNMALEARLIAERDDSEEIKFPTELLSRMSREVVKNSVNDQRKQFIERKATLKGQVGLLEARIKQTRQEIEGLGLEKAATLRQLGFISEELVDLRYLLEKNLVQKTRVLALEREKSRLEGVVGRSTSDMAKAENAIGEAQLQIHQLRQKFAEDVNAQLLDARQKIADARERVIVSKDSLRRAEIRAPRSGRVQGVKVATVGGVIRPGEPLLDLVPENDELIVQAQVSPIDIDAVKESMTAEVKFSTFHAEQLPIILGHITSVSRDRLIDELTRQPYFMVRIAVDEKDIPLQLKGRITAGMPADVMVPTGERTVVDYLVRPLQDRARRAFREK